MLAKALIVVASTFFVLLTLCSVDAQDHVVNDHFRREADHNQSFEKRTSSTFSRQRRTAHSHSKISQNSFSPVKRGLLDSLVGGGQDNHLHETFLHGALNGEAPYNACGPSNGPIPHSAPGDAPFTQGRFAYEKMITCPQGIRNSPKGIVLLVPCTSCDAAQTFQKSPFNIGLARAGFDVCMVDLPNRSLGDAQLSAEFIAYAILFLAARSPASGFRINLLAYSQGVMDTQWALTFWPSVRPRVITFVAVAGTFKGTTFIPLVCGPSALVGGCVPSLLQMSPHSRVVRTLNTGPNAFAQVATTTIFTTEDDLVFPQSDSPAGASYLAGASNMLIQKVCPGMIVDHFGLPVSMAAFGIVFDTFMHGRPSTRATFDRGFCGHQFQDLLAFAGGISTYLQLLFRSLIAPHQRVGMILKEVTTLSTTDEPKLQQYVCARGFASPQECTVGFCGREARQSIPSGLLGSKNGLTSIFGKHGDPLGPALATVTGPAQALPGLPRLPRLPLLG